MPGVCPPGGMLKFPIDRRNDIIISGNKYLEFNFALYDGDNKEVSVFT